MTAQTFPTTTAALDAGAITAVVAVKDVPDAYRMGRCTGAGHDRTITCWKGASYAHARCLLCGGRLGTTTRILQGRAMLVAPAIAKTWAAADKAAKAAAKAAKIDAGELEAKHLTVGMVINAGRGQGPARVYAIRQNGRYSTRIDVTLELNAERVRQTLYGRYSSAQYAPATTVTATYRKADTVPVIDAADFEPMPVAEYLLAVSQARLAVNPAAMAKSQADAARYATDADELEARLGATAERVTRRRRWAANSTAGAARYRAELEAAQELVAWAGAQLVGALLELAEPAAQAALTITGDAETGELEEGAWAPGSPAEVYGPETFEEEPEPASCAGAGEGYWRCDVAGGCADCRALARAAADDDQLEEWEAELELERRHQAEENAAANEADRQPGASHSHAAAYCSSCT